MQEPQFHMPSADFRRYGHALIDWIADYRERIERLPVQSRARAGELRAQLPAAAPERGEPFGAMLADIDRLILPGITHWQSPNFFAYFPSNSSFPAILGDLLSTGLGVQGMLWATSPACTELETHMLDWLVGMLALPASFLSTGPGGGVIQDTASSASLVALLAARERLRRRHGDGADARLTCYTSNQAHSSIAKAARVAGIAEDRVRFIGVDDQFAMRPDELRARMDADAAAGLLPAYVCATVGTTSSLAVDPLAAIGPVAAAHGAWLHVDSAMSGTAALCPEFRGMNAGLEQADSYVFNPHKWMFTSFDCSCFFVRDREPLLAALSILPEYLRNRATLSGAVIDYRDWQIPLGRRFRALKLWFVIRHYGVEGLRAHIRRHVELAAGFAAQLAGDRRFELAAPVALNLVCFRHRGGDESNMRLMERLNAGGSLYLSHTRLNERIALRLCVGQSHTEAEHVNRAWQCIQAEADRLD